MTDELLDIVDKNDNVIDQKLRSEVYKENLCNFRVINAFLMNDNKELWVPRRTKHKRIFPSCLDASVGGHVTSGETYKEALARELMEELRIDASSVFYSHIGTLNPYQHKTSAFMHVYLLYTNEIPNYNRKDFAEYFWLSPKRLLERIIGGERCKDDLPIIIRNLFMNVSKIVE